MVKTDKEIITDGGWAECYICKALFARKRETLRYCKHCLQGFCEGEHGTFSNGRGAYCVRCASDSTFPKPHLEIENEKK